MARMARLVVPHFPHHVTQRGNRRQKTFFCDDDYLTYIDLLAAAKNKASVRIWAYCLMPNHVHLVVVPDTTKSLSQLFSDAHRRYTRHINFREGWRGHLWQERFHSVVMDERHLLAAVRYIELNPVRAGISDLPERWPWSSVHAHLVGEDDRLTSVEPLLKRVGDWRDYLMVNESPEMLDRIREHSRTGRPVGDEAFLDVLRSLTGVDWRKRKPGPAGR